MMEPDQELMARYKKAKAEGGGARDFSEQEQQRILNNLIMELPWPGRYARWVKESEPSSEEAIIMVQMTDSDWDLMERYVKSKGQGIFTPKERQRLAEYVRIAFPPPQRYPHS